MEVVATLAGYYGRLGGSWRELKLSRHTQAALVSGISACWAGSVEMDLADAADIVFGDIPSPGRHGVPLLDRDLHGCDCNCHRSSGGESFKFINDSKARSSQVGEKSKNLWIG